MLVSWAVPKGPTLDPDVKRMAVHVEDHPLDYFDFEGVIPGGEYGGGDVIVWDWGTWEPAKGERPAGRHRVRRPPHRPAGREARRPLRPRPAGQSRMTRSSGCCSTSTTTHAVAGWDPEDHPRSVKSGRTNDEVKAAPPATWSSSASWAGATADELAALDALGKAGEWQLGEHTLKLTNLDKVLFPGRRGKGPALTKRDLIRHHATMAPAMLPYLADRPVNLHRFPDGVDRDRLLAEGRPEARPRLAHALALRRPRQGRDGVVPGARLARRRSRGSPTTAPSSCTRGPRAPDVPHEPTWAMIDIDPGTKATFDDALVLARLYRTALDHLDVQARPKVTGKRGIQIWVPVAAGLHLRGDPGLGGDRSRGPSATPCPSWSAGSGRRPSDAASPASTTPRTRSTRRSSRRSAPAPSPGRRCPCRSPGTSSTTPSSGPTAGRSGPSASDWRPPAIRWHRSIGVQQRLPSL